jgi:hypothetical protein
MARLRLVLVGLLAAALTAQAPAPSEYQLKAAFLYNFGKFVEWPASAFPAPDTPFGVCILGEDPFGLDLETVLRGKTLVGRELLLRRLHSESEWPRCHILFTSGPPPVSLLDPPREGLLTVGEAPGFTRSGGVVRFVVDAGKVRFEINPDAADRAKLRISSKLLRLARIVR